MAEPDGETRLTEDQRRSQDEVEATSLPSPAERRVFKLLPLTWVVVFVLAAIILYFVFR
jgi:peptidoglycan/LPS O-acetylase OafA/YrhL